MLERRTRSVALWATVAIALAGGLALSGVAQAGYGEGDGHCGDRHLGRGRNDCEQSSGPTLTVSNSAPRAGRSIVVTGSQFPARATVTVTLYSRPARLGRTGTSSTGTFSVLVRIPESTKPGPHTIVATAPRPPKGQVFASAGINVRPVGSRS